MQIKIVATSDVHGYIMPTNYTTRDNISNFGLAKAASYIKMEQGDNTICLELGDYIQGSPFSYYLAKNEKHSVDELMAVTNYLNYDAGLIGNHEFNYGREYLEKAITAAHYPILAANIIDTVTSEPAFGEPYLILERAGVKIAILGLTTSYIPNWEQPEHIKNLEFKDIVATAAEYVPKLRKLADIVIVAYHGGFEKDLVTGQPTEELTGENEGYRLIEEVPGIDALVTGHQHRVIATKLLGVPVIQPGQKGKYVGEIIFELNKEKEIIFSQAQVIDTGESEPDEHIVQMLTATNEEVESWLDKPLAKVVSGDMSINNPHQVRIEEHPYIEFIQKVQMDATGVDISATALFNNEGKGFSTEITMRDIVTNYIYPNTLAVLKVTGEELRAALEQSAAFLTIDQGEVKFNPKFIEPKPQYYNYDMYEGIDYTIDVSKPVGERIVEFKYHDKDIKDNDVLQIVTNQYRAVGGGNYRMFGPEKIIKEVQIDMTELIADYLAKYPQVVAEVNHNFKVIY